MSNRPIINTLMQAVSERRRRGPDEGFRIAVLHPEDYFALEREIGLALERQENWALAVMRPHTGTRVLLLPQGLEVHCSAGLAQGWAVLENHRGLESMTMVSLASERHGEG